MPVTAIRAVKALLALTLIVPALVGVVASDSSSAPSPKFASFIPPDYRVTKVKVMNLDGSRVPQEVVTAVGPVNASGQATSLVLVLAWDSYVKRWTSVYDPLHQPSLQTSSQLCKGPGPVGGVSLIRYESSLARVQQYAA